MSAEGHRRYVAVFLLQRRGPAFVRVFLVRKTHPEWQAGLMNAVGGEIEPGETPLEAAVREFREETGWGVSPAHMDQFCSEHGPGYEVHFFRHWLPEGVETADVDWSSNDKGEELEWCNAANPIYPVIGNLHWLLPMAMDPRPIHVVVKTTGDIRKIATW